MVANGYARTYRANAVLTASSGHLVLMLYDGVLKALSIARDAFGRPSDDIRRIETIHIQLLKAQAILHDLQSGLDMNVGGDFAVTMHRLYDYHCRRLFQANLRKQVDPVIEVERLVGELRDAWAQMLGGQNGSPSASAPVLERVSRVA